MFEDIRLDSKEVELDYDESTQEYNTSWVLVAHKRVHIVSSHAGDEQQSVPDKMWDILSALGQVSYTTWEKACREFVKGTAFYGHSKTLIEQGRVLKTGKGKSIRYEAVV